jgi:hypothetical protein
MVKTRIFRFISKTFGLKEHVPNLYERYEFRIRRSQNGVSISTRVPKRDYALSGRNVTHYRCTCRLYLPLYQINGVTSQNTIVFFTQHMFITVTYALPVLPYPCFEQHLLPKVNKLARIFPSVACD